jgi:hypothetical protein
MFFKHNLTLKKYLFKEKKYKKTTKIQLHY